MAELPLYRSDDNTVQFEEVLNDTRQAPFTKEDFHNFLKKELAEENLEFYEEVEEFKASSEDTESVRSEEKAQELTEKYIKADAEKQINISGQTREQIINVVTTSPTVPKKVFDDAQSQVKDMLLSGTFFRFIKEAATKNITPEQGNWRKKIGMILAAVGLLIEVVVIVVNVLLLGTGNVFESRYWRLLGLPFFTGSYSYYVSGRKCLCSGLAARGVYMRPGENKTWRDIYYQKNKDENKIIDDYASKKLAWEGKKLTMQSVAAGILATALFVVLPPGTDFYPDL